MDHAKEKSIDWGKYVTAFRQWWPVIVSIVTVIGGFVLAHASAMNRVDALEDRMEKVEKQADIDHDILVELRANMEAVKVFMERIDRKLP